MLHTSGFAGFSRKNAGMCPECGNPLYGSASRGRHGGYFPSYHCDHRGHYFRKTKKEFDATIENFVKHVTVAPEYIDLLMEKMGDQFDKQLINLHRDATALDLRIANLRGQIRQAVDKIQFLSSETTIKYIEEDIEKMEAEAAEFIYQARDYAAAKSIGHRKNRRVCPVLSGTP